MCRPACTDAQAGLHIGCSHATNSDFLESRSECTKKMKVIPYEPVNEKTDLRTHAPNEDLDQYGLLPTLISVSQSVLDTTSADLPIVLIAKTDLIILMCRLICDFAGHKNQIFGLVMPWLRYYVN